MGKARVLAQLQRKQLDVVLGADDVVAGLVVARFRERRHGEDGDVLDIVHLFGSACHFLLEKSILVFQEVCGGFERQTGLHAG